MGDLLDRDKVSDSFRAVQAFLQVAKLNTNKHHFDLKLKVSVLRQNFNDLFEIECRDLIDNESFIIHSNVFKANKYYRPVWSSHVYMIFNKSTESLEFELEDVKYTLNH